MGLRKALGLRKAINKVVAVSNPTRPLPDQIPNLTPFLPNAGAVVADLEAMAKRSDVVARYFDAYSTGVFKHPDGRTDLLGSVKVMPDAAAMLSHLAKQSPTPLTIEVGFGMGSTSSVILATLQEHRDDFEHIVFDPYGLQNGGGDVVLSYLEELFSPKFKRVRQMSQIGLGQLALERGNGCAGLIFIDGSHFFENVMVDFLLSDALCAIGGHIAFDNSWFPAVESAVNYVSANRPDYQVFHLPVSNLSVARKISADKREWSSFIPFTVPNRRDWTAAPHN